MNEPRVSQRKIAQIEAILTQPIKSRLDSEVKQVAKWLQKSVKALSEISIDILSTLVQHCELQTCQKRELIIREGDLGDRMYILLSGSAQVYQLDRPTHVEGTENNCSHADAALSNPLGHLAVGQTINDLSILGQCVGILQAGAIFGEVTLVEKCLRTASVVASCPNDAESVDGSLQQGVPTPDSSAPEKSCNLLMITIDVYNATVKSTIEQQFRYRMDFINRMSCFLRLAPHAKKQILAGLEIEKIDFDTTIVRTGMPFHGIHFLIEGEVVGVTSTKLHNSGFLKGNNQKETYIMRGLSCVGDIELLFNCCPYIYTVRTTTTSVLLFMNKRNVLRHFFGATDRKMPPKIPIIARRMQHELCANVIKRLEYRLAVNPHSDRPVTRAHLHRLQAIYHEHHKHIENHDKMIEGILVKKKRQLPERKPRNEYSNYPERQKDVVDKSHGKAHKEQKIRGFEPPFSINGKVISERTRLLNLRLQEERVRRMGLQTEIFEFIQRLEKT